MSDIRFKSATIRGKGAFPMDMLRYDSCFPRHSVDAYTILDTVKEPQKEWCVQVLTPFTFTVARWMSFGVGISLDD